MKWKKFLRENLLTTIITFLLLSSLLFWNYQSEGFVHILLNEDPTALQSSLETYGILAIIPFIGFIFVEVFLSIPGFIIYASAGALFGGVIGFIISLVGNIMASTAVFFISKKLGRDKLKRYISHEKLIKFDKVTQKHGGTILFFLRLNPVTSVDALSYIAGFSKMKYRTFLIATTLGLIPYIFSTAYLGVFITKTSNISYYLLLFILALQLFLFSIIVSVLIVQETSKIIPKLYKS